MNFTPSSGDPLDAEASKLQARVLEHVLRDNVVRGPVSVEHLVAELGEEAEAALALLVAYGLMEVVPDGKVQPTGPATRLWELSRYFNR